MKSRFLDLDIRVGGLGDIWMRLVSFYAVAKLRPDIRIRLLLPDKLRRVARHGFGDGLEILDELPVSGRIVYAVRGLRDLIPTAISGLRYASPYGRVVIHDRKIRSFKDQLNATAYTVSDWLGLVYSPPWGSFQYYQGYSEVVTLPVFRPIEIDHFVEALRAIGPILRERLQAAPCSEGFEVPSYIGDRAVIFPTGTGYQFIPLEWARLHLPDAVYAFFHRDPEMEKWREAGLSVVPFKTEPGDMIALALRAKVAASTDSFASHVLQSVTDKSVVMLTELPHHRIVSPIFAGQVVPSLAACHPCLHRERSSFPTCSSGHAACLNWNSPDYAWRIKQALDIASATRH